MIIGELLDKASVGDKIVSKSLGMSWTIIERYSESPNITVTVATPNTDKWPKNYQPFELWSGGGLENLLSINDLSVL